jgi:hypothetical protein
MNDVKSFGKRCAGQSVQCAKPALLMSTPKHGLMLGTGKYWKPRLSEFDLQVLIDVYRKVGDMRRVTLLIDVQDIIRCRSFSKFSGYFIKSKSDKIIELLGNLIVLDKRVKP